MHLQSPPNVPGHHAKDIAPQIEERHGSLNGLKNGVIVFTNSWEIRVEFSLYIFGGCLSNRILKFGDTKWLENGLI